MKLKSTFQKALRIAPNDYAGLLLMSKCQLAQGKAKEGLHYAQQAKNRYPQEAQALHMTGMLSLENRKFKQALSNFDAYEKRLPRKPHDYILQRRFLRSPSETRDMAANEYYRFLKVNNQGGYAKHAYDRLVGWGYLQ